MYDAIIVGARCAGGPTAMLLARKGYRVLLVDKATFPSDTISTHIIWPHGAEIMDRWGLLDRLAATGCPPVALNLIFDVGPFALKGGVTDTNGGRGGFCPRRTVLDKLLVDAAVEAGAELREGFTAEALLWDGDRVAGIKGHSRTGGAVEERARVVIGADGVHSLVAKAVRAPEYDVQAAAHHELLQLLQRIRGRRSRGVRPRLPGGWLLPDARRSHPHRGAVAQPQVRRGTRRYRGPRHARCSSPRRASRTGCRAHGAKKSGSARPASPTISGSRSVRAGRSSATRDTTRIRSPRRGSATPSSMQRHWPRRSTMAGPGGARSATRWPSIRRAATSAPSRCTSSPASWRRWNRHRRTCSGSLQRCAAIRRPRTSSFRRSPARVHYRRS